MTKTKVCVIGLGYIGLPTASILASKNFNVVGVDNNPNVVASLKKGKVHISEPNLNILFKKCQNNGSLQISSELESADIFIICVPTPFKKNDQTKPDIDFVINAAKSISKVIKPGDLVILESTSPIGTTEKVCKLIQDEGISTSDIYFAYCPERVLPGNIIKELNENDRIVGGVDSQSSNKAFEFYNSFVSGSIHITDSKTAEMCKLVENSFRDVNIAFANEISLICDRLNIDAWHLIELANRHPRVNILQPGIGVGGHCIAVDPIFLASTDQENSKLIQLSRKINNNKKDWVIKKIEKSIEEFKIANKKLPSIACLGLTFKPNVDDIRNSPAIDIVSKLSKKGLDLYIVEPNLKDHKIFQISSLDDAIDAADIICFLVNHNEFQSIKNDIKYHKKKFLDYCGVLN